MPILKIFGILDIMAGIVLILLKWSIGIKLAWILAIYLIVKLLIFFKDIGTWIDFASAIFIIFAINGSYFSFTWIFALWLLGKGFISLFG